MLGDDEVLDPFVNTLVLDDEVLGGGVDVLIGLTSFDVLLGLPPLPFTALTVLIVLVVLIVFVPPLFVFFGLSGLTLVPFGSVVLSGLTLVGGGVFPPPDFFSYDKFAYPLNENLRFFAVDFPGGWTGFPDL